MGWKKALGALVIGLLLFPARVWAAQFFVIFFSYDGGCRHPFGTHTFATFVKVAADGKWVREGRIEGRTISWLPETFERDRFIYPVGRQRGHNFTLEQTLMFADEGDLVVSHWGAYPISERVYQRGVDRARYLDRGHIDYRLVDAPVREGIRADVALNCIHAVSDIAAPIATGLLRGAAATEVVVDLFASRRLVSSRNEVGWVLPLVLRHLRDVR